MSSDVKYDVKCLNMVPWFSQWNMTQGKSSSLALVYIENENIHSKWVVFVNFVFISDVDADELSKRLISDQLQHVIHQSYMTWTCSMWKVAHHNWSDPFLNFPPPYEWVTTSSINMAPDHLGCCCFCGLQIAKCCNRYNYHVNACNTMSLQLLHYNNKKVANQD